MSDENFLSRWSRRKRAAKDTTEAVEDKPVEAQAPQPPQPVPPSEPVPLPPIESLTPESDFTPFMQASVDPGVKGQALKKLFADSRFNVMDGLDTYIDDYTKTTPIPEGWLEKMEQMRHLGIFKPEMKSKDEQPAEPVDGVAGVNQKTLQEQSVTEAPSVTSNNEIIATPVGESEGPKG